MTLMALALTVGILVDDATVVLENIHRHLHGGDEPETAAINGRNEIGLAALAITAADIVVYTPIAFMSMAKFPSVIWFAASTVKLPAMRSRVPLCPLPIT